jgi:hypothetical protein
MTMKSANMIASLNEPVSTSEHESSTVHLRMQEQSPRTEGTAPEVQAATPFEEVEQPHVDLQCNEPRDAPKGRHGHRHGEVGVNLRDIKVHHLDCGMLESALEVASKTKGPLNRRIEVLACSKV